MMENTKTRCFFVYVELPNFGIALSFIIQVDRDEVKTRTGPTDAPLTRPELEVPLLEETTLHAVQ